MVFFLALMNFSFDDPITTGLNLPFSVKKR
jgi:hypothetical protein